jgi:hypothetical protein
MTILPVDRTLSIYGALADRSETKGARQRLSASRSSQWGGGNCRRHSGSACHRFFGKKLGKTK